VITQDTPHPKTALRAADIVISGIGKARFCEAHAVTITDGTRSAVYVPLETLLREREGHQLGGT
jgi:5,10-methylene-tetrahydrofolate dehydrogenase/methenyl tetrahydrofolate cyclohydrolase